MDLTKLIDSSLNRPRSEGDVDVIAKLEKSLKESNYPKTDELLNNPTIVSAREGNPDLQAFVIKKVIRTELCKCTQTDTRIARFALETSETPVDLMKNIKKYALPILAAQ